MMPIANAARPGPSLEADLALLLGQARGADFPKRLFWELLSYDRVNEPLPLSVLAADFRGDVAGAIILARAGTLYVVYLHLTVSALSSEVERPILERLAGQWPAALVLCSNFGETEWDFCWHVAGRPRETQRIMVDAEEQAVRKLARLIAGLAAVNLANGQALPELELAEEFDRVFARSSMRKRERMAEEQTEPIFRAIRNWKLLTAEEEKLLCHRWQAHRDARARERLVCSNLRLAVWVARKYLGRGLELEDLIQEGARGLLKAADRFNPERGTRFTTYASIWVRQFIRRAIQTKSFLIYVPTYLFDRDRQFKRAERMPLKSGAASFERAAQEIGMTRKLLKRLYQARMAMRTRQGRTGKVVLLSSVQLVSPQRTEEQLAEWEETCQIVEKGVSALRPRLQMVLRFRFGLNEDNTRLTLRELGERLDLTRERIRQLEEESLEELRISLTKHLVQD
jgi:RNA polymerase primary sigma factor